MVLYLAGPMSGLPDFNFPAFHAAAARLRAQGYVVINPAELDDGDTSHSWDYYMRRDIPMLLTAQAVAVLPGWEQSRGATLEVTIARALGMPVLDAETLQPLPEPTASRKAAVGSITLRDVIDGAIADAFRAGAEWYAIAQVRRDSALIGREMKQWEKDHFYRIAVQRHQRQAGEAIGKAILRLTVEQERRQGTLLKEAV